ncbi:hypothetical protein FGIG_07834 [Fasciola gigantica]|uniref:Uncharacterized protein n=1 Tax=Fasciola gigantica TaxID=46835 RepID=A0A504YRN9_FASGI|nr:hypothetical protein FGIG_07834 [Fasciola gigantica]
MPRDSVYVPDLVPVVRQKHVYSEPPTRRRTRYLSDSPKLSHGRVHVYDMYSQPPTSVTTKFVPRKEYIPIGNRARSISTSRISEVPIRTSHIQTVQNLVPPKPREIYAVIDGNNPSRHSLPIMNDYDSAVIRPQPVVTAQPKQRQSNWSSIYNLDPPQKLRSQSIPDLSTSNRSRKNNPITIIEKEPIVNEVIISRRPMPNDITSTIYIPQGGSMSALPTEACKRPDPPYPIIHTGEPQVRINRETPYPREISTVFPTKHTAEPIKSVPPRMHSDASSVATVNQFNPVSRPAIHNRSVFYSPQDTNYIIDSSYHGASKRVTQPNTHTKIEHEIPTNPVLITVWSENDSRLPYNGDNKQPVSSKKQSKINQMGPPMLFSDLETDSDTSETITRIYQVVAPEPMIKTMHPNTKLSFKPRVTESQTNMSEPLEGIRSNEAVTLLNPNDPDGPKLSDQGPVFLYASRWRHNTRNAHYSD